MSNSKEQDFKETLFSDQIEGFDKMVDFLQSKEENRQLFMLKGYAGTGKTYLLTKVFEYMLSLKEYKYKKMVMTAPTHKAVSVIKSHCSKSLLNNMDFATIQKLLAVRPVITDDGQEVFTSTGSPEIEYHHFVVIDETSMLDDSLFFSLLTAINHKDYMSESAKMRKRVKKPKIIFMGDPMQIPPVNNYDCEPFVDPEKYGIEVYELSEIKRQKKGSEIIEASLMLRQNKKSVQISFDNYLGAQLSKYTTNMQIDRDNLLSEFAILVTSPEYMEAPHLFKVIAYRNLRVGEYNNFIRRYYLGSKGIENPKHIEVGDLLITNRPLKEGELIIINNSTELTVLKSTQTKIPCGPYSKQLVDVFDCVISYYDADRDTNIERSVFILNPTCERILKSILTDFADRAKNTTDRKERGRFWAMYWETFDFFLDYSHAYAITAHKSQGSTYKHVYVDVTDILKNEKIEERNRILYTALTRASDSVTLIYT